MKVIHLGTDGQTHTYELRVEHEHERVFLDALNDGRGVRLQRMQHMRVPGTPYSVHDAATVLAGREIARQGLLALKVREGFRAMREILELEPVDAADDFRPIGQLQFEEGLATTLEQLQGVLAGLVASVGKLEAAAQDVGSHQVSVAHEVSESVALAREVDGIRRAQDAEGGAA